MFYLGIDIAKVNHVASLISEDGSILVKAIKVLIGCLYSLH